MTAKILLTGLPAGYGKKTCQANGTWYMRYTTGSNGSEGKWVEWTDYTRCIDKQRLVTSVYLALGCNACSIIFLVPALLIFLFYRALRRQHRIRLHVNFFTALLLANVTSMLWDIIVTHDRLTSDSATSTPVLMANGFGCKLLAFLRLYFKSTTYVWMFCEGLYLHRLISNAFRPPKSLILLYLAGWGFPLGYSVVYILIRAVYADDSCWAKSFGHWEWIVYCPNLLCLVAISRPLLRDPHRNSRLAPRRRVLARFLLTRSSVSHNRPTVLTVLSAVLTATTRSGRRWKNEMAIPFGSLRPRHTTVLSRRDVGQTRRLATPASKRTRNDA
ncbi:hypothetical protein ACOMHN_019882 [Nucella lapillus]